MRRALCVLGCLSLTLALNPSFAAEVPAGPLDPPQAELPAAPSPTLATLFQELQGARPLSDCPGPWECMQICFENGCLTTNGCDGMGGCLCSNCSSVDQSGSGGDQGAGLDPNGGR